MEELLEEKENDPDEGLVLRDEVKEILLGGSMAKLKTCPYCKGMHRTKRAFLKCKNKNHKESWK